jgi:hypothetical protein
METAIGYRAATRQSWRDETGMKELITRLLDEFPRASLEEIIDKFDERAEVEAEYRKAAVEYAVVTTWNNLERQRATAGLARPNPVPPEVRAERSQQSEKLVQSVKEQIILLNQEMPNGKRSRYCTLDYMYRLGGAYRRVGKQGSQKLVGQVYDEGKYRAKLKGLT